MLNIPLEWQLISSDQSKQSLVPSHLASLFKHMPQWHLYLPYPQSAKKKKRTKFLFIILSKKVWLDITSLEWGLPNDIICVPYLCAVSLQTLQDVPFMVFRLEIVNCHRIIIVTGVDINGIQRPNPVASLATFLEQAYIAMSFWRNVTSNNRK